MAYGICDYQSSYSQTDKLQELSLGDIHMSSYILIIIFLCQNVKIFCVFTKYCNQGHHVGRPSLQCRRIWGWRNLVRVRDIVVVAIFDFMTVEDWEE